MRKERREGLQGLEEEIKLKVRASEAGLIWRCAVPVAVSDTELVPDGCSALVL